MGTDEVSQAHFISVRPIKTNARHINQKGKVTEIRTGIKGSKMHKEREPKHRVCAGKLV